MLLLASFLVFLGPTGGAGGNGGSVYFVGVSELDALKQFRFKKEI
jgi:GTPase involved in cell partitioning and DNA repair